MVRDQHVIKTKAENFLQAMSLQFFYEEQLYNCCPLPGPSLAGLFVF
jgi:hypothetical protein